MGRETLTGPATEYVAAELRAQRARQEWTFDQIADMTGVKRATVMRALKGKSAIAIETLVPLAKGMGVDVVELISKAVRASAEKQD